MYTHYSMFKIEMDYYYHVVYVSSHFLEFPKDEIIKEFTGYCEYEMEFDKKEFLGVAILPPNDKEIIIVGGNVCSLYNEED